LTDPAITKHGDYTGFIKRYRGIRGRTIELAKPLSPEDCQLQSMPDASPTKWHLAHGSWFFETFVLTPHVPGYVEFDAAFSVLFNSYYVGVGERYVRAERGMLSRPSLDRVYEYRAHVDAALETLLAQHNLEDNVFDLVELGLQHEQQHQELILMDILHAFSRNPAGSVYGDYRLPEATDSNAAKWLACPGGVHMIGHEGTGFSFDNEHGRHRVWIEPFEIANQLVSADTYLAFIRDGGYQRPELWLSDGYAEAERQNWSGPLYWRETAQGWDRYSLDGWQPLNPDEPVIHISHYEADAFARWSDARLPTEPEWEVAATLLPLGNIDDSAWQWTASAYLPYPGFQTSSGAVGEYNGKFMANQMVLRGGSFATPRDHVRTSYRNFFPPAARWMFSGIRLARSAG
jgi:ergothioneine biosynthesis protein EgtB